MSYQRMLCALGLCLFSLAGQAAAVRYTFSLPEVTYAERTYAADSISFESESLLPHGPFEFDPLPIRGEDLNGYHLLELTLYGSGSTWHFHSLNPFGNPPAGTIVGLFFELTHPGAPGLGSYSSANAGRLIADGFTFVDSALSGATLTISSVPIPPVVWLLLSGLGGIGAVMRRRRSFPV